MLLAIILLIGVTGTILIATAIVLHFKHKDKVLFRVSKDERRIEKLVVGYILIGAVTSVFVGGPIQLLGMAAMLIICTGGVGLIPIWGGMLICLPFAYGIGSFFFALFSGKKEKKEDETEDSGFPLSNNLVAVSNFIKDARRYNFTDQDIFRQLKGVGWLETDIINGFKFADNVRLT